MRPGVSALITFLFCAAVVFVAGNAAVPTERMPNLGTWTGIRPLEEQLDKLDALAREGPVDALILGSAIGDFGFSARRFSEIMSEAQGRPYRAFNVSTGATELVTTLKIYRLARTTVVPRTLVIVSAYAPIRSNVIPPRSPGYIMARAPIHRALEHPWLLPRDRQLWRAPLVRHATALRDHARHGSFVSLPQQGSDV